jgi:sugar phosphate isomerase/epimerase
MLDAAAWSRQLDAACAELNTTYQQLETADPEDREEAVAHAREVEEFAGALVDVLDEAGTPTEDREAAGRLAELVDELSAAAGELAAAAQGGDSAAAADAARRVGEIGERINPVAASIGAPECGGF